MSNLYEANINNIQIVIPKLKLGDSIRLNGKEARIYERVH